MNRFASLDPRFWNLALALLVTIAWAGLLFVGAVGNAEDPPTAGFDLNLILEAGQRLAAGQSPYDPDLIGGTPPIAWHLFFSYPPPVAQAATLLADLPLAPLHLLNALGAAAAFAWVAVRLVRHWRPGFSATRVSLAVLALAGFCFPWAIGMVYGNASIWLPTVYGLVLLAALRTHPRGRLVATAGAALAVMALKLHPASIGLWAITRSNRPGAERGIAVYAAVTAVAILAGSLLVGGWEPWIDYAALVRSGERSVFLHEVNLGPAAMIAGIVGDNGLVRVLQWPVFIVALGVTLLAARRIPDPVSSLAVAAMASLVTLPVTWYHYAAALLPFGVATVARGGRTIWLIAALVLANASPQLTWPAIALVIWASRSDQSVTRSA